MANLSNDKLLAVLQRSLPGCTIESGAGLVKPAKVTLPDQTSYRVYLWTATPDKSQQGRPRGEHKIQVILPGTHRGARQYFDVQSAGIPILLGYSPVFGVFASWELGAHQGCGYSKNVRLFAI